jgi:hypothetical protein
VILPLFPISGSSGTDARTLRARPRPVKGVQWRRTASFAVALALAALTSAAADTISDPCAPPLHVNVVRAACRFGTATASVTVPAGTQIGWKLTGGTILSGGSANTVNLAFGGTDRAELSATLSGRGCTATDIVTIALRDPLDVATLSVVPPVPLQDELAVILWSYRGSEPARSQRLTVNGQDVRVDASARSFAFTPAAPGPLTVTLDASTFAPVRRRAVRVGDPLPPASSCVRTSRTVTAEIAPPCAHPTAHVTGGGSACDEVSVDATFTGTPPFVGRWSDGASFTTSAAQLTRSVGQRGVYTLTEFSDAQCAGDISGAASVTILHPPHANLAMTPQAAVSVVPGETGTLTISFANASSCTLASALGNGFPSYACAGTGSMVLSYPKDRDRAGEETVSLHVTGPCGGADASTQFFICDYIALMRPSSTTICPGGSVTLHLEPGGTTAGAPFTDYAFYRCAALPPDGCAVSDLVLVQSGTSDSYIATTSGTYFGVLIDRLGCPSRFGTGGSAIRSGICP